MKNLAAFQDAFQRAVVDGDDAVLEDIAENPKEDRRVLLGVYRNAYVLRLIEILGNDYGKLHTLLGDEQFGEMARTFIAAHPSRTRNARWYGTRLPEFLRSESPYKSQPALAELAELERALNDVFDAADAPVLGMEELGAVAPEDWAGLTFTPHPAVHRLDHATNATDIWQALQEEETPPPPEALDAPQPVAVCRSGGAATFRPMSPDEAMMWDEAANGVSFSVLCEMLAMYAGEEEAPARAAGYLKAWVEAGMLRRAP